MVKLGDTVVDKVYPGAVVTLDGSGSTADAPGRTITVYSWFDGTHVAGCSTTSPETTPSPRIEGPPEIPAGAQLTFTAPDLAPGAADVKYCWFLRVENSAEDISGFAPVNVTVSHSVAPPPAPNKPPVANAGPDQTIKPGRTVTLDGTGSTDDDRIASYSWNRTGGTCTVTTVFGGLSSLTGTNALPSFTAETLASGVASCTHDFILFVTDNDGVLDGTGDSVTVTIIATAENQRPISRAGANQTVESGASVTLDGSLSSDDGTITSYQWVQAGTGAHPPLSNSGVGEVVTFTAPPLAVGADNVTLSYGLIVADDDGDSDTDSVTITVTPPAPLVANAGPDQEVDSRAMFTLDGSGSTGSITSYIWSLTDQSSPLAPGIVGTSAKVVTYTAPTLEPGAVDVKLEFILRVSGSSGTAFDGVEIMVTAPFADPVATAVTAESEYASGATVTLDGSGSTVDRRRGPILCLGTDKRDRRFGNPEFHDRGQPDLHGGYPDCRCPGCDPYLHPDGDRQYGCECDRHGDDHGHPAGSNRYDAPDRRV